MTEILNQPLATETTVATATTVPTPAPEETVVSELILNKFKTVEDLAKSYTNLEALIGKKSEQFTVEDLQAIKKIRGIPTSAEEYGVVEGTPEEVGKFFKEQAHKLGLDKNATLELTAAYKAQMESAIEADQKAAEERHASNEAELKREFGGAFEQRIALAQQAALTIGGEALIEALGEAGLGTNPVVIKALTKLGTMLSEDSIPKSQHGSVFGTSPEEAKNLIRTRMVDPDFRKRYMNAGVPGHDDAVQEMLRLHELASSGR
jgi:hypothetical protein